MKVAPFTAISPVSPWVSGSPLSTSTIRSCMPGSGLPLVFARSSAGSHEGSEETRVKVSLMP